MPKFWSELCTPAAKTLASLHTDVHNPCYKTYLLSVIYLIENRDVPGGRLIFHNAGAYYLAFDQNSE